VDKEYINKVVEDIFVEGMSKLEIKTEVYKRLDKELKGEDRVHLKILEYEIQQLEDDEMEFTDYIVKGMDEYDSNKNLTDYDEENLGCQSGDDDGRELDFG
tara:strand:+ start:502 stop:804 length:303 start_codon:yes stop_codon:yes gene_type:complete